MFIDIYLYANTCEFVFQAHCTSNTYRNIVYTLKNFTIEIYTFCIEIVR